MHTLKTQRKNLDNQLEEHEKYKVQLQQDYESTFQKYKESSDKAVDTILPHFMRPFGRRAKKLFRKHPKAGRPVYFGVVFGSLSVIMTVPVLRGLYSLVFFTGIFSEIFYAMKGEFFLKEFTEYKNQVHTLEKRLEKIFNEAEQLVSVNALASKNILLNEFGMGLAKSNMNRCQESIQYLLESDSPLEQQKQKDDQLDNASAVGDMQVVSRESSHPKVLQKSISKLKQSDKEST